MIEWDERKRLSNIAKHGFDFLRADQVLYGKHVVISSSYSGKEKRYLAVGVIQGRFATVVYTMRNGDYRVISVRSARDDERRRYQALYA